MGTDPIREALGEGDHNCAAEGVEGFLKVETAFSPTDSIRV